MNHIHEEAVDKYLDAVNFRLGEMRVLILDYEVAKESEHPAPLDQLLILLKDRTEYILNDIRKMEEISDAEKAGGDMQTT